MLKATSNFVTYMMVESGFGFCVSCRAGTLPRAAEFCGGRVPNASPSTKARQPPAVYEQPGARRLLDAKSVNERKKECAGLDSLSAFGVWCELCMLLFLRHWPGQFLHVFAVGDCS